MIRVLGNISIHLWICCLAAIPACFFILPVLIGFFPGINPMAAGLGIVIVIGCAAGMAMNAAAKKMMDGLIREGQAWERAGIIQKAEKNYNRAIRLYDSFMLQPFGIGKTEQQITRVLAGFYLNSGVDNENFKLAAQVYLKLNPGDRDIARLWLTKLSRSQFVSSVEQEILSVLAEVHGSDPDLSGWIAKIFLELDRKDFAAQTLYARILNYPATARKYADKIQRVMGTLDMQAKTESAPLAAERLTPVGPAAGSTGFTRMKNKFSRLDPVGKLASMADGLGTFLKRAGQLIRSGFVSFFKMVEYIKTHERARFYLKTGLLVVIAGWLLFFMAGTVSHLFKPEFVEKKTQPVVEQIAKPFTIQVAAYLKQSYADRYARELTEKGLDARVKKVGGGGKTWYVVQVSQFDDKRSAAAFGSRLKQQKIIDDYFVNNN